jgi:hypothetical protein
MNTIITKKLLIALMLTVLSLFSDVAAAQDTASTTSVISKSELEAIIARYYGYIFSDEKSPTLEELRPSWVTAAFNDASRGTSVPTLESLRRDVEQRVNEGTSGDSNRGDMTWLDVLVQWFREWIQRIFGHVSSVTFKSFCGTVVSSWYDRV